MKCNNARCNDNISVSLRPRYYLSMLVSFGVTEWSKYKIMLVRMNFDTTHLSTFTLEVG